MKNRSWMTIKEAADRYVVGRTTLYKMLNDGALVANKCGRATRLPIDENDRRFAELPQYLKPRHLRKRN